MGSLMWKKSRFLPTLQPNRNIFAASPRPNGATVCLLTAPDAARTFSVVSDLGEVADLALPATSGPLELQCGATALLRLHQTRPGGAVHDYVQLRSDLNTNAVAFLKIDLDIALTFAEAALHARRGSEKKFRNQANAFYAYDTVLRLRELLTLTQEDAREIEKRLNRLQSALKQLGALPRMVGIQRQKAG
jgi:hypothetical protein